jgi:hypothetical protein
MQRGLGKAIPGGLPMVGQVPDLPFSEPNDFRQQAAKPPRGELVRNGDQREQTKDSPMRSKKSPFSGRA